MITNFKDFLNEQVLELTSLSKIGDKEIIISEDNLRDIFDFVGEGIDTVTFKPETNEVRITFNENSIGGISLDEWNKVKNILNKFKGKNGFYDYLINTNHNYIELTFDFNDYPIGF
jgi:hypothetical protein